MEAEIRTALRQMTDDEARGALVAKVITDKDMRVVSAVLRAPAMLSGFTETGAKMYLHQYRQKMHPDIVDREKRLKLAIEEVERAGSALVSYLKALANGTDDAEARHSAALAALAEARGEEGAA
jgi:hypothetical protein